MMSVFAPIFTARCNGPAVRGTSYRSVPRRTRSLCTGFLLLNIVVYAGVICACAHRPGEPAAQPAPTPAGPGDADIDAALLRSATAALGDREGCVLIMDPANGRLR